MSLNSRAAVSIQRFYRSCKGQPNPPPTSPVMIDFNNRSLSSMKLDYETYLKMRRSKHKSLLSMKSEKSVIQPPWKKRTSTEIRKHISINLEKLEGKATRIMIDENLPQYATNKIPKRNDLPRSIQSAPSYQVDAKSEDVLQYARELGLNPNPKTQSKIGKYYTQYEFLGKVLQTNTISPWYLLFLVKIKKRQLNMYGFSSVRKGNKGDKERSGIVNHPCFLRGHKDLCAEITRRQENDIWHVI